MDNRGYGSGYSTWGGGGGGSGNRGSGGYDMYGGGYKEPMSSSRGYGGSGGGGHIKRGGSGGSLLSNANADTLIARINQRLDMLSQLEGGFKGPRGERFDQYESYDSRPSSVSSSRDLHRSGGDSYGFGEGHRDSMLFNQRGGSGFGGGIGLGGGGGFDSPSSSFGVAKMRPNMRESFGSAQAGGSGGGGWAGAGQRSPRRGGRAGARGVGGGFGSHRSDPTPLGGGMRGSGGGVLPHRGHSPGGGRGKLPSLLSNRMYPESGGFQGPTPGPQDFPGRLFAGGPRGGRQRGRKRPLNKQVKPQPDVQKKRKQSQGADDEPESKMNKTEGQETDTPQADEPKQEGGENEAEAGDGNTKPADEEDKGTDAEAKVDEKKKPGGKQTPNAKARKRRGFMERLMFACSVCKFRSFYKDEMEVHLESRFHKDHFKFLSSQLSKPTTDFLEEYVQNKFKKTAERVGMLENHSFAICQIYKEQDLTKDLGMEHFMKKAEAAHCAACDMYMPMQLHLIQRHIKSPEHNYNRKGMMEQSKRGSLSVARSILNHKLIGKKLESYIKGENPFVGNQEEQDPEDSVAMEVTELEAAGEAATGQTETAEAKDEALPEGEGDAVAEQNDAAAELEEEKTYEHQENQEEQQEIQEGEEQQEIQEGEEQQENQEGEGEQENLEGEQEDQGEEGFAVEDFEGYVVHDENEDGIYYQEEGGANDAGANDAGNPE